MGGTYPTTAQALIDRALTDTPFLISLVVNDNYPAVLQRARTLGIVQPNEQMTPLDLRRRLILLDNPEGEPQLQQALDVPYRGAAQSAVLDAAMDQMRVMTTQAGGEAKGFFSLDGIAALATAVGGIANGQAQTDAQERITEQQLQQDFILQQQRGERNAQLIKWTVGIASVVAIVALIIYAMKR